ncbi:aldo/keto reductase [Planococcus lenghuensis]|uniref:Aldo/keto reductase n=1 Tax=Planococcus lenghuensis TaxID=2213202 RepID=A0A1Q2KXF5_9BACL|nr:aldo/keto reductase [Planococcus lenghuensis]AQQ52352.1 aldo/keto reductase [Planococcus lenghuensis]
MKRLKLGTSGLEASDIALGCMGLGQLPVSKAEMVIRNAMDLGVNFFDHADIYAAGASESVFAEALGMTPAVRENMIIQTKAGIRKGYYDFSKEHLMRSANDSLKRLKTDYIDIFMLHRPDMLMEPEEVAEAFHELKTSGKVRHFGVSNHNPMQIELLKKHVGQDLIVNQLQLSVLHTGMMDAGVQVNTRHENSVNRDGSVLDYSRLHDMTVQAWSPFRYGQFEGFFLDNKNMPEINAKLQEIADRYGLSKSAIAVAWILRHPARIQAVVGTMTPERLTAISQASGLELTRQEWYEIYRAAGNDLP